MRIIIIVLFSLLLPLAAYPYEFIALNEQQRVNLGIQTSSVSTAPPLA